MKKNILFFALFMLLFSINNYCFSSSWEINPLEWKTPEEVLEFYIQNPDFWKKKLELNYEDYLSWSYVVWRGELFDNKNTPIKNKNINFELNTKRYSTVSNEKWIFNLEVEKNLIDDERLYSLKIDIDENIINSSTISWKNLKEKSIFHFKIKQENEKYNLENLYNTGFTQWKFKKNYIVFRKPSIFWINGVSLTILILLLSLLFYVKYFKKNILKK